MSENPDPIDPNAEPSGASTDGVTYARQHRGDPTDYDRYLASMDASMKQKVALTAAHLLARGHVADMGMGSGAGSEALAALYPLLEVTGVDVSATMVARARARFNRPNLSFMEADIATRCFEPASLDGIFDSSVLHHVTSFGGYDLEAASRALAVQVDMLKTDGVLIVRDFLAPSPVGSVLLDLPVDDGDASEDPLSCSTGALYERFAREFRKLSPDPGFTLETMAPAAEDPPLAPGRRRYRTTHRLAVEFLLRKDYRADWDTEVLEEYCIFDQRGFERRFAALGLRVVASAPIRNPWIIARRFAGRYALWTEERDACSHPATNYVIVGERVGEGAGLRLEELETCEPVGFLRLEHYRDLRSDRVMDLVRRPHLSVDVLPWFEHQGELFVLARRSYPRPILSCRAELEASLDGCRAPDYVTEPICVLQGDKPLGQTVAEALRERVGIGPEAILSMQPGRDYYPSPGGVQEQVHSLLVQVEPLFVRREVENVSGFHSSGHLSAIEARQCLRAAQVGGLPNARLELNVVELLRQQGREWGAWIGAEARVSAGAGFNPPQSVAEVSRRPHRRAFRPCSAPFRPGFLELRCARFGEFDARERLVAERRLEYVVPRSFSSTTVVTALIRRQGDCVLIGVDDDDLPAAQCFTGNSELLVAPAWRLPRLELSLDRAEAFVRERLRLEYGIECGAILPLGGRYHPAPGATPEVVYPRLVEVLSEREAPRALLWLSLVELLGAPTLLREGHLATVAHRVAQALGLIDGRS
jgi:SAM-dependent methyltransferase